MASDNQPAIGAASLYLGSTACDRSRPRLYDQGLAWVPVRHRRSDHRLRLDRAAAAPRGRRAAEHSAGQGARALRLLACELQRQCLPVQPALPECNQVVMGVACHRLGDLSDARTCRARARLHLECAVTTRDRSSRLALADVRACFIPLSATWNDHPEKTLRALRFRISLPDSIEAVRARSRASAQRVRQLCHDERQVVVRRGWSCPPMAAPQRR